MTMMYRWVVATVIATWIFFTSALAAAQHKVQLEEETRLKLGLQQSEYYVIYTAEEYRELRRFSSYQDKLITKLKLKVDLQDMSIQDLRKALELTKKDMDTWKQQSTFLFESWKVCDKKLQLTRTQSWLPWLVTGAALLSTVIASTVAVYYRYK